MQQIWNLIVVHKNPLNHLSNRIKNMYNIVYTREGLGESETVTQTRDEGESLHNCRDQAVLLCFIIWLQ